MSLADEKYMLFTTYRKNGTPVSSATWVVPLDGGRFGLWTSSASGKAKRLRARRRVSAQPSNARGVPKPGSAVVEGTGRLVSEGAEFDAVQAAVRAKYGFMVTISKFGGMIGSLVKRSKIPYGDVVVVITPNP